VRLENIRLEFLGGGAATNANRIPPEFANIRERYPEPTRVGVMPGYGLFARHVRDLELANITTTFRTDDFRPAIVCSDIDGLEIDNFKPQLADGVPAMKLDDTVKNVSIRNSPALQPKAN
jgi:hypothetical protein